MRRLSPQQVGSNDTENRLYVFNHARFYDSYGTCSFLL
jgi:hypothetical protein